MDWDDREQRIADLEYELAALRRGADLPPASPDRAAASRRFEATARGWSAPKAVICVTGDGLTVDGRPGDVFSLSEAKLCLWVHGGSTMGTALHLQCGPHRFVLGGWNHRVASGTQLEAPPVTMVDAWMWAADFDELLSLVAPRMGLDIPRRAPGQPIRCWLSEFQGAWGARSALVIDVGQDAIWVMDPETSAVVASAGLAQVTAIPAYTSRHGTFNKNAVGAVPVLVVRVPGLQTLTIGCRERSGARLRFWWCGKVPLVGPGYAVGATDWLMLVENFGLARHLEDEATRGSGPEPVPWSGLIPTPARRDRAWLAVLPLSIMFAGLALLMFYGSARRFDEYRVGTPTTAAVTATSWLWLALLGGVFLVISIVISVFARSRAGKHFGERGFDAPSHGR